MKKNKKCYCKPNFFFAAKNVRKTNLAIYQGLALKASRLHKWQKLLLFKKANAWFAFLTQSPSVPVHGLQ